MISAECESEDSDASYINHILSVRYKRLHQSEESLFDYYQNFLAKIDAENLNASTEEELSKILADFSLSASLMFSNFGQHRDARDAEGMALQRALLSGNAKSLKSVEIVHNTTSHDTEPFKYHVSNTRIPTVQCRAPSLRFDEIICTCLCRVCSYLAEIGLRSESMKLLERCDKTYFNNSPANRLIHSTFLVIEFEKTLNFGVNIMQLERVERALAILDPAESLITYEKVLPLLPQWNSEKLEQFIGDVNEREILQKLTEDPCFSQFKLLQIRARAHLLLVKLFSLREMKVMAKKHLEKGLDICKTYFMDELSHYFTFYQLALELDSVDLANIKQALFEAYKYLLTWIDEAFNDPEDCKTLLKNNSCNLLFAKMCFILVNMAGQKPPQSFPKRKWQSICEHASSWFETNMIGRYYHPESSQTGEFYLSCATRLMIFMEKTDKPCVELLERAVSYYKKAQHIYEPIAKIYPERYIHTCKSISDLNILISHL
ncbi:hypothetical protein Ciccas_000265 [Cichlidogyrus casuarinus]|uniref:Uncharacterized protein n=1 Tax=Cichlidogyrus casuarinus TaxID=1844966 RepID=A0ABD2QNH0_9PLAT